MQIRFDTRQSAAEDIWKLVQATEFADLPTRVFTCRARNADLRLRHSVPPMRERTSRMMKKMRRRRRKEMQRRKSLQQRVEQVRPVVASRRLALLMFGFGEHPWLFYHVPVMLSFTVDLSVRCFCVWFFSWSSVLFVCVDVCACTTVCECPVLLAHETALNEIAPILLLEYCALINILSLLFVNTVLLLLLSPQKEAKPKVMIAVALSRVTALQSVHFTSFEAPKRKSLMCNHTFKSNHYFWSV